MLGFTFIKDLEDNYDAIIWDLPPTDQSARSRMLAQFTQGVILVAESGKTRWQAALHSIEHFKHSGAQVLGVILNKKKTTPRLPQLFAPEVKNFTLPTLSIQSYEDAFDDSTDSDTINAEDINIDDYLSDDEIPDYRTHTSNYSADDDEKSVPYAAGISFNFILFWLQKFCTSLHTLSPF